MSTGDDVRRELVRRLVELRRSNAAAPIPSKRKYVRKAKHRQRGEAG